MTAPQDVHLAWVHSDQVAHSWVMSLMGAVFASPRLDGRPSAVRCGTDGLPAARNAAVTAFLKTDSQWLWWVDTDMGFRSDALNQLLAVADPVERPIVGGLCFSNREIGADGYNGYRTMAVPTLYRWLELPDGRSGFQPIWDYPRDEVVEVAATGSAFIVIHRSVFEAIGGGWYDRVHHGGELLGEDLSFCYRARESFPLHVHTGVRTTHLKPVWLQEGDYVQPTFDSEEVAG